MLRKFFSYYKPYKGLFILDFSCAVVAGLLELGFPLIVNQFIDKLLPGQNWTLILWACFGLLAVYMLNAGLQYVVTYWGHMLGVNIETDMRQKLFDHIQKLSFRFFDNNKTGHLISRLTNDLMEIGEIAHHGPEDLFIAVMTLVGAFSFMMMINWKLALLTFFVIPFLLWLALYFNKKMTGTFRRLFSDVADFNACIENNVGGIRVVQAFGNEKFEKEQFAVNNARFRTTKLMAYKIMALNSSISYMLMRLVTLFVLICGTWFVLQDVFLFSGTIRENIAYGNLKASEAEIWQAVKRAQLEDLIYSQPDGLDTVIGERGVKLSGGQKQRLAIARMFLKNPPILILDEATSALDTETELAIQKSLAELSVGRTTLVIAHRLATIKNADRIVVVNKDGIAEQGSHNELIEQGGGYSRLYEAQFSS
ncbi:ABC transporter ATP-binding protein [Bacillus cereus]